MTEQFMDDDQQQVVAKIEKLLRLAGRNTSPEEAASAVAKAQELAVAYNLDIGNINADEDKSAVREKLKLRGGMYVFQRQLFQSVAELNFCMYFTYVRREPTFVNKVDPYDGQKYRKRVVKKHFEHRVIGRLVNTRSTRAMAEYLLATVERLVSERYANAQRWMRAAVVYREGMVDELCERLRDKRRELEEIEARKQANAAARAGTSTSTALTIASFSKAEEEANMEFHYGAEFMQRRKARAQAQREAEEAYTRWADANPEEARKEQEKLQKEFDKRMARERNRRSAPSEADKRYAEHSGEYWSGRDKGKQISIDQQVSDRPESAPKRIGR